MILMLVNSEEDPLDFAAYPLEYLAEKELVLKFLDGNDTIPPNIIILDDSHGYYFLESKDYDSITLQELISDITKNLA